MLFTGAGASVELGVPAMRSMAREFYQHLKDHQFSSTSLNRLEELLKDEKYDMEHVIEELDSLEKGRQASERWGVETNNDIFRETGTLRQEAEWLISHLCERINSKASLHMWGESLLEGAKSQLIIATTNYDRAIEMASAQVGVAINDGFEGFGVREYASWAGLPYDRNSNGIELIKLHGSTDWYHSPNYDAIYKLRHPMPLFGALRIVLDGGPDIELRSAAVLPSREKKINQLPYPDLSSLFRVRADAASSLIIMGSSLRDPDIRSLCDQQSKKKAVYVVSRTGRTDLIPKEARVIRQSASRFMISSLPMYLRQNDPEYLDMYVGESHEYLESILNDVLNAFNNSELTKLRCEAIESLAKVRVSLGYGSLEKLLRTGDDDVSMYALGLIPDSLEKEELLKVAKSLATERGHNFNEELLLLERQLEM